MERKVTRIVNDLDEIDLNDVVQEVGTLIEIEKYIEEDIEDLLPETNVEETSEELADDES